MKLAGTVSLLVVAALWAVGCGSDDDDGDPNGTAGTGGGSFNPNPGGGGDGGPLNGTPGVFGSYELGDPVTGDNVPTPATGNTTTGCGKILTGVVRDFQDSHPDFETFSGTSATLNMVEDTLGAASKPVYADDPSRDQSTGEANFNQWYRNVSEVNRPYYVKIELEQNGDIATFESDAFFPLDGEGFGNQGREHNYHFTTEFHTEFQYNGGETFRFTGDDDLWVFINRKLAIDLGGLHPELSAEVRLDEVAGQLGIETGKVYELSLFHAERHTEHSHFRVDTTMTFVNCGKIPPVE
jgi:fibro-slime domain-containing protein